MDRVLPNSIEIEHSILGIILIDGSLINTIEINKDYFYFKQHQLIFASMLSLKNQNTPIDLITVSGELKKTKELDFIGGSLYLTTLINSVGTTKNLDSYVKILKEKFYHRKLMYACKGIINNSYDYETNENNLKTLYAETLEIIGYLKGKTEISIAEKVKEYVLVTSCDIVVTEMYKNLDLVTSCDKATARKNIERLCEAKIIESVKNRSGIYRKIDNVIDEIDIFSANDENFPIWLPLGLHKIVDIQRKNIIVVAGVSNSGKSAFLLNIAHNNKHTHKINYFSSEMGDSELKKRLKRFDGSLEDWRNVKFIERSSNFSDVIKKDEINIIDYLEENSEAYMVTQRLKEIFDKLDQGIAIVALQKNPGQAHGRGGYGTIDKPRLYLTLDDYVCKIEKAKAFPEGKPNPNKLKIKYKLERNGEITPESNWQTEDGFSAIGLMICEGRNYTTQQSDMPF